MCCFRSLKKARSRQVGRAYDVGVTKGERKITNLFKHPGYRHERTILIKTDTIYLFTWFSCAVYKTWFSRDYTLLPGAYSRETTVFFPDLTLRLSLHLSHTLDRLVNGDQHLFGYQHEGE